MEEKKPKEKKAFVSDAAGTLFKTSILKKFAERLTDVSLFNPVHLGGIKEVTRQYNLPPGDPGHIDHNEAVKKLSALFSKGVAGQLVEEVEKEGRKCAEEVYNKYMFGAVPVYFSMLKKLGYDIHLITGAPEEVVKELAYQLDADGYHALRLPKTATGKRYTGGRPYHGSVMTAEKKKETFKKKIEPSYPEGTSYLGDSLIDTRLLEHAKEKGFAALITGARDTPDAEAVKLAKEMNIRIEPNIGNAVEALLTEELRKIKELLKQEALEPAETEKLKKKSAELDGRIHDVRTLSLVDAVNEKIDRIAVINSKEKKTNEDRMELEKLEKEVEKEKKLLERNGETN